MAENLPEGLRAGQLIAHTCNLGYNRDYTIVCKACQYERDRQYQNEVKIRAKDILSEQSFIDKAPHYNRHPSGVECITIVEHMNFNIGNAVKYLWRAGEKNPKTKIEDLRKAEYYVKREIERLEGKAEAPPKEESRR